jgi:hypothetical protein
MKTWIEIDGRLIDLEAHLSRARTIVTLGKNSEEAYNVIALDDEELDVFQCQFTRSGEGWKVQNGQWRTDCPKGIHSRLQHACSLCMGCCVNVHPGQPTYGWRLPEKPTLCNGTEIGTEGVDLKDGDVIEVGKRRMIVKLKNKG